MAHYAFLNGNIVTEVITGIDETELIEGLTPEQWYSNFRGRPCIRTSYNGKIRGKYAGIGDLYDEESDTFISPNYLVQATGITGATGLTGAAGEIQETNRTEIETIAEPVYQAPAEAESEDLPVE
jgi:hypothetical protein